MTEANNNANSFNSKFNLEPLELAGNNQENREEEASATASEFNLIENNSRLDNAPEQIIIKDGEEVDRADLSEQKMNWQKVAHKLREYNRKLLKKVFRLEHDLADIDNKFTKYVEKSRSSDVLVAQQEQKIKKYQDQTESLDRQLADYQAIIDQQEVKLADLSQEQELSQQHTARLEQEIGKYQDQTELCDRQLTDYQAIIDQKEVIMTSLSQQHGLAQQQSAQLERDCALLQENYNHQVYELTIKDKEIEELQNKLAEQQSAAVQYKTELKSYQKPEIVPATIPVKEPAIAKGHYSSQRTIQPWSTSDIPETKIVLPKTKTQPAAKRVTSSEAIQTAAQIATWSVSQANERASKMEKITAKPQSSVKVKPKSLAAVDLPSFPRPV